MWLVNQIAGFVMNLIMHPLRLLPDWAALLVLSGLIGGFMLLVFRYTSNQPALKGLGDRFRADLLSLRLFPEHPRLIFGCQLRMLHTALLRLYYSLPPLAVMTIPMILLLIQMAVWFEHRPLRPGEDAVLAVTITPHAWQDRHHLTVHPSPGLLVKLGPLQIPQRRELNWKIGSQTAGRYQLDVKLGQHQVQKQVVVGRTLAPVSTTRPDRGVIAQLLHPVERPLPTDSGISAITVFYPSRATALLVWHPHWLISFFILSIVVAVILRPVFRVYL